MRKGWSFRKVFVATYSISCFHGAEFMLLMTLILTFTKKTHLHLTDRIVFIMKMRHLTLQKETLWGRCANTGFERGGGGRLSKYLEIGPCQSALPVVSRDESIGRTACSRANSSHPENDSNTCIRLFDRMSECI